LKSSSENDISYLKTTGNNTQTTRARSERAQSAIFKIAPLGASIKLQFEPTRGRKVLIFYVAAAALFWNLKLQLIRTSNTKERAP
jgi:hypothetical protein